MSDPTAPSPTGMFDKTTFTKAGWPRLGTTITLEVTGGDLEDLKVVGHLQGRGPEGRNGLVGIIVQYSDGYRESLEWPLVPEVR